MSQEADTRRPWILHREKGGGEGAPVTSSQRRTQARSYMSPDL